MFCFGYLIRKYLWPSVSEMSPLWQFNPTKQIKELISFLLACVTRSELICFDIFPTGRFPDLKGKFIRKIFSDNED